jgi:imidazolonepropionase-like amidohydrolase
MKHKRPLLLLIPILLFFFTACDDESTQGPEPDQGGIVLRNGLLIDGTGAEPVEEAAVLIQNGRIAAVGRNSDVSIPENATVIDLEGATILPGFINAHVHDGFDENNLKAWAESGVTTVRDLGSEYGPAFFLLRDDLNNDNENARLIAAGPMLTVPGGYPDVPWQDPSAYPVSTVEEAIQATEEVINEGADLIKISLDRGDIFQMVLPVLSDTMAAEIVRVAHEEGAVVSAHVLAARDIDLALNAGIDEIAHMAGTYASNDQINQVAQAGTYWVTTLELWYHIGYGYVNVAIENLRRFVLVGGMVALGTDFAGYAGAFDLGMPVREIGYMADAGMTPMEIIVAATRNAAKVCDLENDLGTLETGKIADILVVNGNPLEDLPGALTDVRLVIHNGEIIHEVSGLH